MRIHHVGLEVGDLFAVERFYHRVLGFARRYRYVSRNTPGLRTVFLERGEVRLELLERPRGAPRRGEVPGHLALEVGDVDAEHARLLGAGLGEVVSRPPRDTGDGFRELELRDPEGNLVELSARIAPEPRPAVRAAIFDLDGTLVDSEENYYLADRELLARRGIPFTREDKRPFVGRGNLEMLGELRDRFGLPESAEALAEEKNAIYLSLAETGTRVFPGVHRLLERLRARGLPVAVASGTSPAVLSRLLEVLGLAGSLAAVVSAEEVPRGKPAPDVFLEAARRLGVPPQECVVLEDSRHGVEATLRAFMRCIAVPPPEEGPLAPELGMADLLVEGGPAALDPEAVLAWLEPLLTRTAG